jgi:predicted transcriptional regulator
VTTRRDDVTIVAEILERATTELAKSKVYYEAKLSSKMVNKYLGLMMEAQLMEAVPLGSKASFQISDKGKRFLQFYHEIEALLEADENKKRMTTDGVQRLPKGLPPYRFSRKRESLRP